ncbi:hypothetical protein [Oryzifoliimicrobium ureilyticus]|uniref:hypothetical protein n=1 Tax=Oryzifoliimicrobium ureilyticus TaxID=3113724 RepID=UPI00307641D2
MRHTAAKLILAGAVLVFSQLSCAAEDIPAFWRKSMTNDPATNYYLAKSLKPLASNDAQTLRIVKMSLIIRSLCKGASIVPEVGNAFLRQAGYQAIQGEAFKEAAFLADNSFAYFDYRQLAHLCAGSAYLFGPEGHLVKGLIKGGSGEPAIPYGPNDPYLQLPPTTK